MKTFNLKKVMIAAVVVLAVVFPFLAGEYYRHLAILALMYAVLALSWDLAARAELVSFAHAGFFGLGAYASAVTFLKLDFPLIVSFIAAVLLSVVIAIALGYLTLRLSGIYFAIATLAFSQVLLVVALQFPQITGGAMGISLPSLFGGMRVFSYYLILGILVATIAVSLYLERSHYHLAFSAMRTSSRVASVLGVNTVRYRLTAFTLSAVFACLAGAFYVHYTTTTIPYEAFNLNIGVVAIVMAVLGGLYSTVGPITGAIVLRIVEEYMRVTIPYGYMLIYGLVLILGILFMPKGIVGVLRRWKSFKLKA